MTPLRRIIDCSRFPPNAHGANWAKTTYFALGVISARGRFGLCESPCRKLIGDQNVDSLASKSAEYCGILALSSGNSHRSRDVTEGIQVDSNHPIAGRVLDFLSVCVIESQADIPHRAAVANFLKLLR